ncbi:hypothetical protein CEQ21_07230 (plasmid) [Niallia circulans]|uniref:Uncharacterized protein n=1 Tax=Niallia circulans TaxID=1397 RepID=A0A553SQU6_NIACI|nr:hypothetical protein [Niallia circulans]TRZ39346.1 hypothetical protein CEQ21_07230 [Niallia circulans]
MECLKVKHMRALILTHEINVPDYLIQKVSENCFLIHRELEPKELHYYANEKERILEYKGQKFLLSISSFESLVEAEKAILEYWSVIKMMDIKVKSKINYLLSRGSNHLKGVLSHGISKSLRRNTVRKSS